MEAEEQEENCRFDSEKMKITEGGNMVSKRPTQSGRPTHEEQKVEE